ncbi:hypothetical protein H0H93_011818, partial [Arthromyces matolae]
MWATQLAEHEKVREYLSAELERFRNKRRFRVLDLYRSSFDPHQEGNFDHHPPAHRYLFQAYVYQYHLIQFAWIVLEMLDEMIRLEKERNTQRLWTPVERLFRWNNWQLSDTVRNGDDEDP